MQLFGPSYKVKVVDGGQELGFHLRGQPSVMKLLIAAIGVGFVVYGVVTLMWIFAVLAIFLLWYSLRAVFNPTDQWLHANRDGLIAYGGLIRWQRILLVSYEGRGKDGPSHLAIRTVTGTTTVFPDISRAQCEEIIDTIYGRFPMAPMTQDPAPATMFRKWPAATAVGVSNKD